MTVAVPVLPPGASWPTRLLFGLRALFILKDDAGNPQAGALVNRCFDYEVYRAHLTRMQGTDEGRRLIAQRPSLQRGELDLGALAALPAGTLGRELVRYFEANGFPPFATDQDLLDELDYLSKRYRETHDCYHVVTGYTTDDLGEMELQAFVMGNLGISSPWVITVFGYLPVAVLQHRMGPTSYVRLLRAAWERGRRARPFLEFPFEERWAARVDDLRAELLTPPAMPTH